MFTRICTNSCTPPPHTNTHLLQVEVVGVSEELKRIAYDALTTRPNFAYTLKEVEADLKRVFATGGCRYHGRMSGVDVDGGGGVRLSAVQYMQESAK